MLRLILKGEEPTSSVTSSVEIQNETVAQSVVASSESVLRFSKTGEKQRVTVEDGYNIQLSLETQVLFTPVE